MRNDLTGKKVLAYTRVSTKDQKDFGHSLSAQKKAIKHFCNGYHMLLVESFEEDFSAKNFNRPVFTRVKEFAKANKGKIDYLLVQKWDRFSRNVGQGLLMIETLKKWGIQVNCIENWIDYDSPDHIVMLSLYLSTPEAENTKISERTIAGTREALKQGRYVKSIPKGYISGRDSNNKTLMQPDPKTAPLIKDLFEDFATGLYSQQELIKKYGIKGLDISTSSLSRILDNVLYMGKVVVPAYKNEPKIMVKGLHVPLISENIFFKSQSVKHGKRHQAKKQIEKNEKFPLTGFLQCAECGHVIYGSQSNNGKKKKVTRMYYYYQCNSKCKRKRYAVEIVHQELERVFMSLKPSQEILNLFEKILIDEYKTVKNSRLKDIKDIDKQIGEVDHNQMLLTEKYGLDKIKEDVYNKLMDNYEKELVDLRALKAELGDFQEDLDKFVSFGLTLLVNLDIFYKKANIDTKMKLLGSIFVEKLQFFEDSFRTLPFNDAIVLLCKYNKDFQRLENKKGDSFSKVSRSVPGVGIEPTHRSTRV
ncbi:MAG: recombinase family protein [Bacteroidia bacterium]